MRTLFLLQVVCAEACRSGCFTVACDAVAALHANIVAATDNKGDACEQDPDHGNAQGMGGNAKAGHMTLVEADVLRTHLNCLEAHFKSLGE